jgi:ABC-type uncharacterized transport system auxiliary subunit
MKKYLFATVMLLAGCISVFPESGEPAKKVFLCLCPFNHREQASNPNVLIVEHPHANGDLASKNIKIIHGGMCSPIADKIAEYEWEDKLPDLIETAIMEALEQSNVFKGVARNSDLVKGDLRLVIDIRRFDVNILCEPYVEVEMAFRVLTATDYKLLAQRTFCYHQPFECVTIREILDAYSCAVDQLLIDLTTWLAKIK